MSILKKGKASSSSAQPAFGTMPQPYLQLKFYCESPASVYPGFAVEIGIVINFTG